MKIYAAEKYHDNSCGLFSDRAKALAHGQSCCLCEIVEYEERDGIFVPTVDIALDGTESPVDPCLVEYAGRLVAP